MPRRKKIIEKKPIDKSNPMRRGTRLQQAEQIEAKMKFLESQQYRDAIERIRSAREFSEKFQIESMTFIDKDRIHNEVEQHRKEMSDLSQSLVDKLFNKWPMK